METDTSRTHIETLNDLDEAIALLTACDLPVADISPLQLFQFFGIRVDGALVAMVGFEPHAPFGLLRSLAVHPAYRNRGFAHALVTHAEPLAAAQGVETLYLLTTTAKDFFLGLGYSPASRDGAPPAIRETAQFGNLCPASSAFLSKPIHTKE